MTYLTPNETAGGMAGLPGHRVSDEDIRLVGLPSPLDAEIERDPRTKLPAVEVAPDEPKTWERVLRKGIFPQFSTAALKRLLKAILAKDERIIQGQTMAPRPLACNAGEAVEACCPVCWLIAEPGTLTVAELEQQFAETLWGSDERLGFPASGRHLFDFLDEADREHMLFELELELRREINIREWPTQEGLVANGTR
jgi:hypothetical protein